MDKAKHGLSLGCTTNPVDLVGRDVDAVRRERHGKRRGNLAIVFDRRAGHVEDDEARWGHLTRSGITNDFLAWSDISNSFE